MGVYIHVPFCQARCAYCDFNTYAGLNDVIPFYVSALCREIERAGERWRSRAVDTVYFGGGTPSILSLESLDALFQALHAAFQLLPRAEITLEANPGTITSDDLRGLKALGINRLSLGVQSAHEDELRLLGRIHTWEESVATLQAARASGFDNINMDFIFGLPGQSKTRWRETLDAALSLAPDHLSLYALTLEEETPLARQIDRGDYAAPDDDWAAEMYELAQEKLAEAGFIHYEISNWAKSPPASSLSRVASEMTVHQSPHVCRHNLHYWRNEPWLGLGAGAHSWLDGKRWANVRHPQAYVDALDQDISLVAEEAHVDRQRQMEETMMLGLRLIEGIDDQRFHARFGCHLVATFGEEIEKLSRQNLITWDGRTVELTARGRLLGNLVFMQFV